MAAFVRLCKGIEKAKNPRHFLGGEKFESESGAIFRQIVAAWGGVDRFRSGRSEGTPHLVEIIRPSLALAAFLQNASVRSRHARGVALGWYAGGSLALWGQFPRGDRFSSQNQILLFPFSPFCGKPIRSVS